MKLTARIGGFSISEMCIATVVVGIVGLIIYSLLNIGTILSAKNTAVNSAHQNARTAMLQMVQDIHSSVSLPQLVDVNGAPITLPGPSATPAPAEGLAFQLWSTGPFQICANAASGQNVVQIKLAANKKDPVVGQRLIIPLCEIEEDITAVTPVTGGKMNITLARNLTVPINNTTASAYHVDCFVTDRCSYIVRNKALTWNGPTTRAAFSKIGSDITNDKPFLTPQTANGAYDYKFIAAIKLSTADQKYNARNFKSANILLNGKVPMRAKLTKTQ